MSSLAEYFSLEKENVLHPINYKSIMRYQQNDKSLVETSEIYKDYLIKHLHGVDKNIFSCL